MVGYRGFILTKDGDKNVATKYEKGKVRCVLKHKSMKTLMEDIDFYLFERDYGEDYDKLITHHEEK